MAGMRGAAGERRNKTAAFSAGALKRSGQCQESELKERLVQILEDRFKIALANAYAYGLDTLGS